MKNIEAKIPVLFFEEGDQVIAYSPALDLSSCGETEEKARIKFTEAAAIFLAEITRTGTVDDVLAECGWCKAPQSQEWTPPVYKTCKEELISIPLGA